MPEERQAERASAVEDKLLHERFPALSNGDLSRLTVLEQGARLEQRGIYLDLSRLADGPFKVLGGHEATASNRFIAKRDTDFELWNRLASDDSQLEVERPAESRS